MKYSTLSLHIISLSSLLICSSTLVGFSAPEQRPLPPEFQKEIASIEVDAAFDEDGQTPLILAVKQNNLPAVSHFIKKNPGDINKPCTKNRYPLFAAAHIGSIPIAKTLIENQANINQENLKPNETALMRAAYKGHAPLVDYLISAKADIHAMFEQEYSVLDCAVLENPTGANAKNAKTIRILKAAGAKFNKIIPTFYTAILEAQHTLLSNLIDLQEDINTPIIVDGKAYTPFEYSFLRKKASVINPNVAAAKMLIDAGADLTKTAGYLGKSVPIETLTVYAKDLNWEGYSKEETEIMDIFTYALRFGTVNNLVKNKALSKALTVYYAPAAHRLIQAGATVKTSPGTHGHDFLESAEKAVQNRRKNNQKRKAAAMLKLDEEKLPIDLGKIVGTYMDDEE